jgi:hypothetical protein
MSTAIVGLVSKDVSRKESWHYRYYAFILRFWGKKVPPAKTSLCPYFHTILWLSVGAIALSWLFLAGWIMLAFMRFVYKTMERAGWNKTIDLIDDTPIGDWIGAATPEKIREEPAKTTFLTAILSIMLCMIVSIIAICIFYVCYGVVWTVPRIPYLIQHLGYYIFVAFSKVGQAIHAVGSWFAWLFSNGDLWLFIGQYAAVVLIGAAICFVFGLVVWKFLQTDMGKKVTGFFVLRWNGFGEARRRAEDRRINSPAPVTPEGPAKEKKPFILKRIFFAVLTWFVELFEREVVIGGTTTTVLGPLGLLWKYLKAKKQKVCPVIEFLDDATINRTIAIANACDVMDKPTSADSYLLSNLVIDFKYGALSKDELFTRWLDGGAIKVLLDVNKIPVYVQLMVGKYILGYTTRDMVLDQIVGYLNQIRYSENEQMVYNPSVSVEPLPPATGVEGA